MIEHKVKKKWGKHKKSWDKFYKHKVWIKISLSLYKSKWKQFYKIKNIESTSLVLIMTNQ